MKLLVTGAGGRIGTAFRSRSALLGAAGHPPVDGVVWIGHAAETSATAGDGLDEVVDLRKPSEVENLVRTVAPEVIVHLGGLTGAACQTDAARTRAVNVDATRLLAETARDSGTRRFVFASSSAVYGDRYLAPVTESSEPDPRSAYGQSKNDAELALRQVVGSPGFSCVALRIFNVFGPGFDDSLVNRLIDSSPQSPVVLNGLDDFVRDYIHVADVIDAVDRAIAADLPESFTAINVGTGIPRSNRALVEELRESHDIFVRVEAERSSYSCADPHRAFDILGFKATRHALLSDFMPTTAPETDRTTRAH